MGVINAIFSMSQGCLSIWLYLEYASMNEKRQKPEAVSMRQSICGSEYESLGQALVHTHPPLPIIFFDHHNVQGRWDM